nr:hypothetical protein [Xenophilus azovorans]
MRQPPAAGPKTSRYSTISSGRSGITAGRWPSASGALYITHQVDPRARSSLSTSIEQVVSMCTSNQWRFCACRCAHKWLKNVRISAWLRIGAIPGRSQTSSGANTSTRPSMSFRSKDAA